MPKGGKRDGAGRPAGSRNKFSIEINLTFGNRLMNIEQATLPELRVHLGKLHTVLHGIDAFSATLNSANLEGDGFDLPQLADLQENLQRNIDVFSAEIERRQNCFKPYIHVYCPRTYELPRQISGLRATIKQGKTDVDRKRTELIKTGVSDEMAEKVYPAYDEANDLAEIDKREIELAAWEKFNLTGLEKNKPSNADSLLPHYKPYNAIPA